MRARGPAGAGGAGERVKSTLAFLAKPDRRHTFAAWLRMLLEDMLVIDAACVYPRFTRGGSLYSLDVIDGSTIKEKVFAWAKEQVQEKADIAKLEKVLGLAQPEEGPGQGAGGGRPATNKKNPKAKQKGTASGGRVVLSTSR